jgi:hypothetical protein
LQGRGFNVLPQLFRDVFAISAKLDVHYIWIDSICIIQDGDDGSDRAERSAEDGTIPPVFLTHDRWEDV